MTSSYLEPLFVGGIQLGPENLERFKDGFELMVQGLEGSPSVGFLGVGVFRKVVKYEGGISEEDEVGLREIAVTDIVIALFGGNSGVRSWNGTGEEKREANTPA